jgi:hypothetical protein
MESDLDRRDSFILVSEDCPAEAGTVPRTKDGESTIASIHYELLSTEPYRYTQADILFETHVRRKGSPEELVEPGRSRARRDFFSVPQACLRASPLPKTYGWGLHFDAEGRIGLVAVESKEYGRFRDGRTKGVVILQAMRNSRK